jgi:hypothetical protein
MPSAGFEPAIPTIKRLQTYALDRTANKNNYIFLIYIDMCQPYCNTADIQIQFIQNTYIELSDDNEEKILEIDRGSTRSHPVENSLWKRLRTCRKTDYRMNE